jgi:hypothetical protein
MESDIQRLELASGIKDSLIDAGFTTIDFIYRSTVTDISEKLGIDLYVAQIIYEEAKKMRDIAAAATDAPSIATAVNKDNDYNNKHTHIHNTYAYHILVLNHSPRITLSKQLHYP